MDATTRAHRFVLGCLAAAAFVVVGLAMAFGPWDLGPWWVNVDNLSLLAQLWAVLCCGLAASRSQGRMRVSWTLFGVMISLYLGGDILWLAFGGASGAPPILSVADLLYLVGLVPGAVGLIAYPVTRGLRSTLGPVLLDAGVLGFSALLASQVFVFDEVISQSGSSRDAFMLLVYPVTDVLLACLVLLVLLRSVGEARVDVVLLGLTFALYAFADNGYALSVARNGTYADTLVGVVYVVAPLCLALGALTIGAFTTSERMLRRHLSGIWAPLLPDLTALLALGVSVVFWLEDTTVGVMAGTVLTLTAVRQLVGTRQAQRWRLELEQRVQERTEEVALITERHRQLEKLKYSFVTAVSHELRTPLTAIHGSLEMLDEGDAGNLPPQAQRVVTVAARGTRRLARLVDDIIDLERLQSGEFGVDPQPQELADLFADAAESLTGLARAAGLELVVGDIEAQALCDNDRIQQALVNLIGNAAKFTPPGGRITLDASIVGDEVEITVSDEGRGIPPDQLDAVFERFHQVEASDDQAKGGTGLGLTITQHIVEAHGGRIWVDSRLGSGTTFHFTLPLVPVTPHPGHPRAQVPAAVLG